MYRARHPSNCHHMSHNATPATQFARCHHLTHCHPPNACNSTRLKRCTCQAKSWRRSPKWCACHEAGKLSSEIFWEPWKSIAPVTQSNFRHVVTRVAGSQTAMPATRNEATRRLKPFKAPSFAKLAIGTAIATSCRRLRTVAQRYKHTLNLNPQTHKNGHPCYASGERWRKKLRSLFILSAYNPHMFL